MKPRHTLALLVFLLLLCAVYYGQQYRRVQREESARVARKVFDFAPEDLRRLTIDRIDGPACAAERDGDGGWRIIEPNPTITPFH
ncbi:MAG TPA: hypothetical protein ENN29_03855, partial [Candidatus Hydrogenedentes bacterium]|nr:hypothetical protein [Candidatus Hydrogenedentota bacterium]